MMEIIYFNKMNRYIDPDVNTDPASIVYTRRVVPNGGFFLTDRPDVPVNECITNYYTVYQ